ncbi:cytochrome P450 [Dendrothele bispora CBS 962.96]|uniref:Cytochrome P450 n=1 Tax=Dendrothele bispora (strain CBS 962.96) TaxID=1314807 RepID=A0A4S8L4P4_DENBC|nr:cytochrome P450 [Dendrothele bispora CBS 962.96]
MAINASPWVVFGGFVLLYLAQRLVDFWRNVRLMKLNHPGFRTLFSQRTFFGNLLPPMTGVTPGRNMAFLRKHKIFQYFGSDVIVNVSAFPSEPFVNIADPAIITEVTSSRARFPKPVEQYTVLSFFGRNIVASEGEEWKKYRKISAPAFSDRNNKLVWDESLRIMDDLFANVWGDQDTIVVDHCVDITLPIALFVIGVAGFGRKISWQSDLIIPPNHSMTFKDALHEVTVGVFTKLVFPKWMMGWTERLRKVQRAFDELDQYMMEMIHARRTSEKKEERYDLFSSLLDANDQDDDGDEEFEFDDGEGGKERGKKLKLTERELIGNIFFFFWLLDMSGRVWVWVWWKEYVDGEKGPGLIVLRRRRRRSLETQDYESLSLCRSDDCLTTAHTLCYTFALLALYPDKQEKLYQQIKSLMKEDRLPTYEEMSLFTRSMGVFYETLRMFPPVNVIPKTSAEDTVFHTINHSGERVSVPIPKGTSIVINTPGLHNNPRYWKDPQDFRPERFLEEWPRDAFAPFSVSCIGRKFFETEGIAILTMLVSKYKIEVKEEPQYANETFEERKARIFQTSPGLTLTPIWVPLVLKRRV